MSPHASQVHNDARQKFLFYGGVGSGKTTLARTIPGRKFLYMFDPAGLNSIKPTDDITYETFLPDNISMSLSTLKGVKDSQAPSYSPSDTYVKWEKDFENRLNKSWFTDSTVEIDGVKGGFDAIILDSLTTLSDLIMDRILEINGRSGKNPEISDYGILTSTIARIVRNAAATGCYLCLTAHEAAAQDKLMRTVGMKIMVTGQLKEKLPILFSDIYHTKVTRNAQGAPQYEIDTIPDEMYSTARCSLELKPTEVVSITTPQDATLSGIGKILRAKGLWTK